MLRIILIASLGALFNRIRGGFLKDRVFFGSTQIVRGLWAIWFSSVVFLSIVPFDVIPYLELGVSKWVLLTITGFAAWALFGSGAHQNINIELWKDAWAKGEHPDDTEIFTEFWLPNLFHGKPNWSWSTNKFNAYHIIGKATEGALRNALCLFPLCVSHPVTSFGFVALGLTWGPLYWIACNVPQTWVLKNSQLGEAFVGFTSFLFLAIML